MLMSLNQIANDFMFYSSSGPCTAFAGLFHIILQKNLTQGIGLVTHLLKTS